MVTGHARLRRGHPNIPGPIGKRKWHCQLAKRGIKHDDGRQFWWMARSLLILLEMNLHGPHPCGGLCWNTTHRGAIFENGHWPEPGQHFVPPTIFAGTCQSLRAPLLLTSTRQSVSVQGLISLHIRIGHIQVQIRFGIVGRLVVDIVLGKAFM